MEDLMNKIEIDCSCGNHLYAEDHRIKTEWDLTCIKCGLRYVVDIESRTISVFSLKKGLISAYLAQPQN